MAKRSKPRNGWKELARQQRILQAKRTGKPDIPTRVLHKLAALRIPEANQFVYQACLEKLLRENA